MNQAHKQRLCGKMNHETDSCPLCRAGRLTTALRYDHPPAGETVFPSLAGRCYHRTYDRCDLCGLFVGRIPSEMARFYTEEYVDATYGERLCATYERIMALSPEQSDNTQRVRAVQDFMLQRTSDRASTVLDVGSGLCVFLSKMRTEGWQCTALDPDSRAATHAREAVGVEALCGDFMTIDLPIHYDLVTFNKVLEHVTDPIAMLAKSRSILAQGGVVYVELPDGEMAVHEGPGREEFFIEHLWVFSAVSLEFLALRAGLVMQRLDRVREPSGKFTLRAFMMAG
jgi:SAM-dependent methyltransferase